VSITTIAVEKQNKITYEIASELLDINELTGSFIWKWRERKWFNRDKDWKTWNSRFAGTAALTAKEGPDGRSVGFILGKRFKASRVAFLLYYGYWPDGLVDHIDGDPTNNSKLNLRVVDDSGNNKNQKRSIRNTSGHVGVDWYEEYEKWRVRILRKTLGYFSSFEEACSIRKEAEKKYGFHPNHGRD